VKTDPNSRVNATKQGAYILSVTRDGTSLLHGPYATPRARTLVALQLSEQDRDATLLLVDYAAHELQLEAFDAAAASHLALVDAPSSPGNGQRNGNSVHHRDDTESGRSLTARGPRGG
jgi:hypothetical protein